MEPRSPQTPAGRRACASARTNTYALIAAVVALYFTSPAFASTDAEASAAAIATAATNSASSTTATGTIVVTATSLPELVTDTESCAILCYGAACLDAGCHPGDLDCACDNPNSLVVEMGICVGRDCDGSRAFDAGGWIASVCSAYDKVASSTAIVSSASALLVSEISEASATATVNPIPTTVDISNTATASPGSSDSTAVRSVHSAVGGLLVVTLSMALSLVGGAMLL